MTRILPIDDVVLVETTMKGKLQQPFGGVSASEVPFSIHRGFLFRISSGKVTELWSFMNRKELAEAVGQWPMR